MCVSCLVTRHAVCNFLYGDNNDDDDHNNKNNNRERTKKNCITFNLHIECRSVSVNCSQLAMFTIKYRKCALNKLSNFHYINVTCTFNSLI